MGRNPVSKRVYMAASYGRLRQMCEPDTPGAEKRVIEKGERKGQEIWELISQSFTGRLDEISFVADRGYGNQWMLAMSDVGDEVWITVSEDSRYGSDLLKKIPNLFKGKTYTVMPYDYMKKVRGQEKHKVGLAIEDAATKERVESPYQKFTKKEDDTYLIENLLGFPTFEGTSDDKEDLKIYYAKVLKFLRPRAMQHIHDGFINHGVSDVAATPEPGDKEPDEIDPLPF